MLADMKGSHLDFFGGVNSLSHGSVQWPVHTNTSVADRCGHVEIERHETEVRFPHLPKFHISDHKEFLKSNGVDMCLVFSLTW